MGARAPCSGLGALRFARRAAFCFVLGLLFRRRGRYTNTRRSGFSNKTVRVPGVVADTSQAAADGFDELAGSWPSRPRFTPAGGEGTILEHPEQRGVQPAVSRRGAEVAARMLGQTPIQTDRPAAGSATCLSNRLPGRPRTVPGDRQMRRGQARRDCMSQAA